ncbi:MAG: hypothetical protein MJ252_16325 [archaeon]|nr:hypothetical protein [archaeon]
MKLPKQDWSIPSDQIKEVRMSDETYDQLYNCVKEFEENGKVDPKVIRDGLRSIGFHKEHISIYKIIEDICLDCELKDTKLTPTEFMNCINDSLGDNVSHKGLNRIFQNLCDNQKGEITPKNLCDVFEDELSEDDIKYLLTVISEPSDKINITSDEFFYIMTKKPEEALKITSVTKENTSES